VAGGDHAQVVWCQVCGVRAERTYEGDETDEYKCVKGHTFGIDWRGRPPSTPQWPPPPELKPFVESLAKGGR